MGLSVDCECFEFWLHKSKLNTKHNLHATQMFSPLGHYVLLWSAFILLKLKDKQTNWGKRRVELAHDSFPATRLSKTPSYASKRKWSTSVYISINHITTKDSKVEKAMLSSKLVFQHNKSTTIYWNILLQSSH